MKPIIFSGPMVRAIQAGTKLQTRRVVNRGLDAGDIVHNIELFQDEWLASGVGDTGYGFVVDVIPSYQLGDVLWVRETWAKDVPGCPGGISYLADHIHPDGDGPDAIKWRPSIHMPRWAARIFLRVTNVRCERVQDISAKDIIAEGAVARPHEVDGLGKCPVSAFDGKCYVDLKSLWASGWDSINAKRGYGWDVNPWVWVYEFERVEE